MDRIDLAKIMDRNENWVVQRSRMKNGKLELHAYTISIDDLAKLEKTLGRAETERYLENAVRRSDHWAQGGTLRG